MMIQRFSALPTSQRTAVSAPAQKQEAMMPLFGSETSGKSSYGEIEGKSISDIVPPTPGYDKIPDHIDKERISNWEPMEMYAFSDPKRTRWVMFNNGMTKKPTILGINGRGIHWDESASFFGPQTMQNDMPYSDIIDLTLLRGRKSNEIRITGRKEGTQVFSYLEKDSSEKLYAVIRERYQFYANKNATVKKHEESF